MWRVTVTEWHARPGGASDPVVCIFDAQCVRGSTARRRALKHARTLLPESKRWATLYASVRPLRPEVTA